MQRADGVVELLAALVIAAHAFAQHLQQPGIGDGADLRLLGRDGQCLQRVEQAPRIAIGIGNQALQRFIFHSWNRFHRLGFGHNLLQILSREALQHIHRRAGQQSRVHLKGRVLRGRPDEGKQTAFHVRQKRVLLAFVEAVHLIHKHDGALRHQPTARRFGLLHSFTNVLDPAQHGTDGDELRIKRIGHQPGDGGFTHSRWAPQDATVRAA